MSLSQLDRKTLETLFSLCAVRVRRRGGAPGPELPPGACSGLEEVDGRLQVRISGWDGPLVVLGRPGPIRRLPPVGPGRGGRGGVPRGPAGLPAGRPELGGAAAVLRPPAGGAVAEAAPAGLPAGPGRLRPRFPPALLRPLLPAGDAARRRLPRRNGPLPVPGRRIRGGIPGRGPGLVRPLPGHPPALRGDLLLLFPADACLHALGRLELLDGRRVRPRLLRYDLDAGELEELDPADLRRRLALPVSFEFAAERPLHDNPAVRRLLELLRRTWPTRRRPTPSTGWPAGAAAGPRARATRGGPPAGLGGAAHALAGLGVGPGRRLAGGSLPLALRPSASAAP